MKKEITAEYMHKLLKEGAFKDVDLSRLATMSDDERRVFTIEQADRLLGAQGYGDTMRWYMGQFFDDDFFDSVRIGKDIFHISNFVF